MVKISDLSNEIAKAIAEYTDDVKESVEQAKDEVSKEAVQLLKEGSPRLTGDYAKGWERVKTRKGFVIRNRTDYQLTHLLEYGHAKRDGGRTEPKVHIRPVEEQTVNEFIQRVEKAIKS